MIFNFDNYFVFPLTFFRNLNKNTFNKQQHKILNRQKNKTF